MTVTDPSEIPLQVKEVPQIYFLGLGHNAGCWYWVVGCPQLQLARANNGLGWKNFHVTLGFDQRDRHDISKGPKTCVEQSMDMDTIFACLEDHFKTLKNSKLEKEMFQFSFELIATSLRGSITQDQKLRLLEHKALLHFCNRDFQQSLVAAQEGILLKENERLLIRAADASMQLSQEDQALICYWKAYLQSNGKPKTYAMNKIKTLWKKGTVSVEMFLEQAWVPMTEQQYRQYQDERMYIVEPGESFEPFCVEEPRIRVHVDCITMKQELPRFFSWVVPFVLAGMSTPKSRNDIIALEQLGIGIVITLTEEEPLPASWFHDTSVQNVFWPVTNYYAPYVTHVDHFMKLLATQRCSERPRGILVHCGGGKGRAGTLLATYLARFGLSTPPLPCDHCQIQSAYRCISPNCFFAQDPVMSASEAIQLIRTMRPGSIETERQENFVATYISDLWARNKLSERVVHRVIEDPSDTTDFFSFGNQHCKPTLILLCGLPASGKSTFAKKMEQEGWTVISQDELHTLEACEKQFALSIKKHKVIVDRCNHTRKSRKAFIAMAGNPVTAIIHFNSSPETCIQRAQQRLDHPTLQPWQAESAVSTFATQFEPPEASEGTCLYVVKTRKQTDALLVHFGVTPESAFIKYPRTRHLCDIGAASRDDLIFSKDDAQRFLRPYEDEILVIQEKWDGANVGFRLDPNGKIVCQNRTHTVTSQYHPQFQGLQAWVYQHQSSLYHILSKNTMLFGEWLAATHSVYYDSLPDVFLAFDILDLTTNQFYSVARTRALLDTTTIHMAPCLPVPPNPTQQSIMELLHTKSQYSTSQLEGVVLRLDKHDHLVQKCKLVRTDFIQDSQHWSKSSIRWNKVQ
jgi:atypical dual specificity phosphatase